MSAVMLGWVKLTGGDIMDANDLGACVRQWMRAGAGCVVAIGLYLAWEERLAASAIFNGVGLAVFLLSFIDRLAELEFLGQKAKLRDVIRSAEVARDEFRELVELMSGAAVRLESRLHLWGKEFSRQRFIDLRNRIEALLANAGTDREKIRETMEPVRGRIITELSRDVQISIADIYGAPHNAIVQRVNGQPPSDEIARLLAPLNEASAIGDRFAENMMRASPDAVRDAESWIDAILVYAPECRGALDRVRTGPLQALRRYLQTGELDLESFYAGRSTRSTA
jgi:hypothetical protein